MEVENQEGQGPLRDVVPLMMSIVALSSYFYKSDARSWKYVERSIIQFKNPTTPSYFPQP
jgi:hypothetical protein